MNRHRLLTSGYGSVALDLESQALRIRSPEVLGVDWGLGWWHGRWGGEGAAHSRRLWRAAPAARPGQASLGFFESWGFDAGLPSESASLSVAQRARIEAYCQGFNEGWQRPARESPWTPADCHLLVRTLGFLEWWETRAPEIEFLLALVEGGVSWDHLLDLWPDLGAEPDRSPWKGLTLPKAWSQATAFVHGCRRFRRGATLTVPASQSSTGRPLFAASFVTDVTEPGLPFVPVLLDGPGGQVRGLSRPGHPGFLAGKTSRLAWVATPVVDDTVDLRILDRFEAQTLKGVWAGLEGAGTLAALFDLEEAGTAEAARDKTLGRGTATLDVIASDGQSTLAWPLGSRWVRPRPRDAWLPSPWGAETPAGPRQRSQGPQVLQGRWTPSDLEGQITRVDPLGVELWLAPLRFLLPDTDRGRALRRWTGTPSSGPEARDFEALVASVWNSFWEPSPRMMGSRSPLVSTFLPQVARMIQSPHSTWFPSGEKNRRLGEAVRRAFGTGELPSLGATGRLAPKALWVEDLGKPRTFAATVAVVVDPGVPGWRVFHTDDETEEPRFETW